MGSVIISGGTGFIGRHLIQRFVEQNVPVYVMAEPGRGAKNRVVSHPLVHVVECSMDHWSDAIDALPSGADAFICLAWSGVSPEQRNSSSEQLPNIGRTLDSLRLAAAVKAQRFILPGSTTEYADSDGPINGKTCPSPQSMYGATKIATRYLCSAVAEELDIPFIYAVITGIYSADRKDNNVIYYAIKKLLCKERPSFSKLEQKWDYVHIDDAVNALYLIATKGKSGAFYTIGHGDNCPLSEYIFKIRDLIDPDAELGIGDIPYKKGIIPSSCVDLTALREDTGFIPQVSFEEGIKSVIDQVAKEMEA